MNWVNTTSYGNADGVPMTDIRTAFELARKRAGIKNFVLHDLRHCAVTRWVRSGIPQETAMRASGHKSLAMHYRYANMQAEDVVAAFKNLTYFNEDQGDKQANDVSY